MSPGAIVVGAHVNGLGVIRALAARGVRVAAISTRPFDFAQHSRWVAEHQPLPSLHEQPDSLIELLETHARRWHGWTIFPSNDDALTALARHHDRLSRSYRLTVQHWDVAAHVVDKDRMHRLAVGAGLDVPVQYGPATAATVDRTRVRYPVIVKPVQHGRLISACDAKLFLAGNRRELDEAIRTLESIDTPGLLFEFVPGGDRQIVVYALYMDSRGEPSAGITIRKLRQHPSLVGGARVAATTDDVAGLREATVELLRRAGFRGMAFAEFKIDDGTGRPRFIEVNGRAVRFNSLLPPTGIDLVAMSWLDFGMGTALGPERTGWRGAWIDMGADVVASLRHWRFESLRFSDYVAPYLGRKVFAVWSHADPRPAFAQVALAARRGFARDGRGRSGPAPVRAGASRRGGGSHA